MPDQPSTTGHTESEGYAASLRQQAVWIDESREAKVSIYQRITMEDIDTDEMRAAADHIDRLTERCEALEKALRFYASEWQMNGDGDCGTPGLSRSWMEPTDALHDDGGRKAHAALAVNSQERGANAASPADSTPAQRHPE